MNTKQPAVQNPDKLPPRDVLLELKVRNHPGALSHITGLFARRAFNLHAIACAPETGDPETSRILLLVTGGPRLFQVEAQLGKLHDVLSVRRREDTAIGNFLKNLRAVA